MHEATVTIEKIWPPYKPTDTRTNVEDTGGGKWRIGIVESHKLSAGQTVTFAYTEEDFQGKGYKLVKEIRSGSATPATPAGATRSNAGGAPSNGQERGMLMKLAVDLLAQGRSATEVGTLLRAGERCVEDFKNPRPQTTPAQPVFDDEDTF